MIRKAKEEWAYEEMKEEFRKPEPAWLEVTESFYWQALEVLPPIYMPFGFFVGEPECHSKDGTVYAGFTKIRERFFARYLTRSTWNAAYRELDELLVAAAV